MWGPVRDTLTTTSCQWEKCAIPDQLARGCWLPLGETGHKAFLWSIWLLADCHSCPWFTWKMLACLQTLANYSLSSSDTKKCNRIWKRRAFIVKVVPYCCNQHDFTLNANVLHFKFVAHLSHSSWRMPVYFVTSCIDFSLYNILTGNFKHFTLLNGMIPS